MMATEFLYNSSAKHTLAALIDSGRVPHTVLIEGETGLGKKTFAKLVAQSILCEGEQKPCGVCRHCFKIKKNIHPDVVIINPEGGARSFHIDEIRQMRSDAYIKPNEAEKKVYILADAQNMTVQAQNALLKIIEEPPPHAVFILTCDNKAKLLETVVSRVISITLEPPTQQQCLDVLPDFVPDKTDAQYKAAAKAANGNIGKAIALLSDPSLIRLAEVCDKFAYAICFENEYNALKLLAEYEKEREQFILLCDELKQFFCNLAVQACKPDSGTSEYNDRISRLQAIKLTDIIENAKQLAMQNVSMPLVITNLCSQMTAAL